MIAHHVISVTKHLYNFSGKNPKHSAIEHYLLYFYKHYLLIKDYLSKTMTYTWGFKNQQTWTGVVVQW